MKPTDSQTGKRRFTEGEPDLGGERGDTSSHTLNPVPMEREEVPLVRQKRVRDGETVAAAAAAAANAGSADLAMAIANKTTELLQFHRNGTGVPLREWFDEQHKTLYADVIDVAVVRTLKSHLWSIREEVPTYDAATLELEWVVIKAVLLDTGVSRRAFAEVAQLMRTVLPKPLSRVLPRA